MFQEEMSPKRKAITANGESSEAPPNKIGPGTGTTIIYMGCNKVKLL